jgi:hypothetical protein
MIQASGLQETDAEDRVGIFAVQLDDSVPRIALPRPSGL